MQEAFEKIIERLEKEFILAEEDAERYEKGNSNHFKYAKARGYATAMDVAIEIVNQVAEEYKNKFVSIGAYKQVAWERDIAIEQLHDLGYEFGQKIDSNDGWIPCSERLPNTNGRYLVFRPHYYGGESGETTICYFDGQDTWHDADGVDFERILHDGDVIAWQQLPAPYQPKGE